MTTRSWLSAAIALCLSSTTALAQAGGPAYGSFGLDLQARAADVRPGDDFWSHANGGWANRTPIGADSDAVGVSVDMRDKVSADLRRIVENMAAHPDPARAGDKIGALYLSWMDEAGIEARGAAALAPYLERIAAVEDGAGLQALFAGAGFASPVEVGVDADPDDPSRYLVTLGQGSLGMPRDYYLGDAHAQVRAAYRDFVRTMLVLAGVAAKGADADARAGAIVALETAMAGAHWSPAASRDLARMNRRASRADLDAMLPGFDWTRLLADYALADAAPVLVQQDSALAALGDMVAGTPLPTWKDYLAYRFAADHADYLPQAFAAARFAFHQATLGGIGRAPERWKRGVKLVDDTLGDAVGRIYLERHLPPAAVRQVHELVDDLRAAYGARIRAATWMDAPTRRAALAKLAAMKVLVGGPVRHLDYGALRIARDDLLGNVVRADAFARTVRIRRLGKPAERGQWWMPPQQMNAYYDQHDNAIVFPAAVLQPPLFDARADAAVNYGAGGVLIGHEMGHAFDDQGRRFGPDGRIEDWWTARSAQAFQARAEALVAQYDGYRALPDARVDGRLTLGENIADISGVEVAYAAYRRYQARHGKAATIDGLSGEQRFFLAYAQGRRTVLQEAALRQLLLVDTHAPPVLRVNGVLRNVDAWYRAFDVRPGDALYLAPRQRIHLW